MEVIGTITLHVRIWDLCTRAWFGIVDNLGVNILLGTPYIEKCIKGTFFMVGGMVSTHTYAKEILASNPTPSPLVSSVSVDAEGTAIGNAKKPLRAQTEAHRDYTVCVVRTKAVCSQ